MFQKFDVLCQRFVDIVRWDEEPRLLVIFFVGRSIVGEIVSMSMDGCLVYQFGQ